MKVLPQAVYTTHPFTGPLGVKANHKPWPAAPTDVFNMTARFGNGDRINNFKFDMTPGIDAKYQEIQVSAPKALH